MLLAYKQTARPKKRIEGPETKDTYISIKLQHGCQEYTMGKDILFN